MKLDCQLASLEHQRFGAPAGVSGYSVRNGQVCNGHTHQRPYSISAGGPLGAWASVPDHAVVGGVLGDMILGVASEYDGGLGLGIYSRVKAKVGCHGCTYHSAEGSIGTPLEMSEEWGIIPPSVL